VIGNVLVEFQAHRFKELALSYRLLVAESEVFEPGKYANSKGNTECVEFVRQAAGAPQTAAWRKGVHVFEAKSGTIPRGTVIATFDSGGNYPSDGLGQHAAIYLEHSAERIVVLDQWKAQGRVLQRSIRFKRPKGTSRSNDADTFYVVE
jgi:hypothetical protein